MHLHAYFLIALRALAWLFIVVVIFTPLEWLFAVRREKLLRRAMWGDLGYFFLSNFVPPLLLALPMAAAAYVAYRIVPDAWRETVETWPLWVRGLSAFVVADFGFYWGHRLTHRIPLLWRFHAVHHAPEHVYYLISSRAHPVDNAFIRLCGLIPITILGLGAPQSSQGTLVVTLLMLAVTIWGFFIHANVRWRFGPLEWLLATPAFHLWHHTREAPRDRNFASMLPIWDWIFGTAYLPKGQWPAAYGIDDHLPKSVLGQLVYPFGPPRPAAPPAAPIAEPDQPKAV